MKIVYLVNHFAEYGGIQRMLDHKINALNKYSNIDIILITRFQNNREYLFESHKKTKKYDLNINSKNSFFSSIFNTINFYFSLKGILIYEKPDIIITTLTSYYALVLPFIKQKVPKIVEFHSTAKTIKTGSWKYKKIFYQMYNSVIVLNNDEKREYSLTNTVVIPNFIHVESSFELPDFNIRTKTIIAAGRLESVKRFDHLILAWKKIYTNHKDWIIEIYGDGSKRSELNQLIFENELQYSVQLMGNTNDLDKIMRNASIYCMTSKTDCFPMVLLESKYAGLPAISYNCPYGPKNIIKANNDGIIIPNDDLCGYSVALDQLINDLKKREQMSENAFVNFNEYSSLKVIQIWINLFNQLVLKNANI
jgi:glycosyltransferase involved in cell wall biosynthesis